MSISSLSLASHSVTAEGSREVKLASVARPTNQREIQHFLTILANGDYGHYRTTLATSSDSRFEELRRQESDLLFSADGSLPLDCALTPTQEEMVDAILAFYPMNQQKGWRHTVASTVTSLGKRLRSLIG
jgi:hypothetical protein